ncbi:hypothetical protein RJ639_001549 [Escallonia herrerae]|uniref:DUF547 domain-containing protein n=1 Tax=Escallonia herrerae TaxID=1293975 RepID=A0AA89BHI0_9ASTE|nr:hypothetical protein RJ639_001549 [Escallonia herrerae]
MTTQADLTVHVPTTAIRKKKLSGQQRREELEREVSTLRKMLGHEQKVHEVLELVQHRPDGSEICIPNFLPPKTKELLAELAMVDNEIARLEGHINQLQNDLDREKDVTEELNSQQWKNNGTLNNPHRLSSVFANPNRINNGLNVKMAFEAKALHFIDKAIKGDYNLSAFRLPERTGNSRGFPDQKENQERMIPKRSGVLKPSSPLRDPRHPTPKRERNPGDSLDVTPKDSSTPSPSLSEEESIHKLTPNKLSENIMKCLIFIFVRLLRTTRAMELEKSGPVSRSASFSQSFRTDTSLTSKASLLLQKESRQQDPYGIFNMDESIPRDIGPYKNLVRFTSSSLDPKCISNSSSIPLLQKLRVLMNNLQKVDLRFLTYLQKLAFWINMYNACIMHGFLQYGVPSSPEKLLTLMNKAILNVGGNTINAHAIEHFILRKPVSSIMKEGCQKEEKDEKEAIVRRLYGLESSDPNVTFALCCGTCSSPAVRIYTSEGVVTELEKSKLEYLQASIAVTSTRRIALPELLLRNVHEFGQDVDSLVEWLCHQLPTSGSLRKSMVDCFRGLHGGKVSSIVEKIPYEFEFQYLLPM